MNKRLVIALACLLCLTGCVPNLPTAARLAERGEEFATQRMEGCSREKLHKVWGDPQRTSGDGFGDVWFLDEIGEDRITVRYDENDRVTRVLKTVPGQEGVPYPDSTEPTTGVPEDEPTGVAPPEPTDAALLSGPPELTVLCGGETIPAISGTLTWVTENGVLCADSPHPLQMRERMAEYACLETAENRLNFRFTDEKGGFNVYPEEVFVRAWEEDCTPECDHLSTSLTVEERCVELLPGGYIYEVTARWGDGENSGGTTTYMFLVNKLYPGNE